MATVPASQVLSASLAALSMIDCNTHGERSQFALAKPGEHQRLVDQGPFVPEPLKPALHFRAQLGVSFAASVSRRSTRPSVAPRLWARNPSRQPCIEEMCRQLNRLLGIWYDNRLIKQSFPGAQSKRCSITSLSSANNIYGISSRRDWITIHTARPNQGLGSVPILAHLPPPGPLATFHCEDVVCHGSPGGLLKH
jgi:hypothetical protein